MPVAHFIREAMTRASWIRKMFEKGNELKRQFGDANVFDLTLGNPVLEPPDAFFEALRELSERRTEGLHRYMANAGYPAVRKAIADRHAADGTFPGATENDVVMTVGAAGGMNTVLKAILNPGDEVLLLAPYFVEYGFYVQNHGGVPVVVQTAPDHDLDPSAVAAALTPRTRALIVNSPNNPSGRLYPEASLKALAEVLAESERRTGVPIHLLSDEPYRELVFVGDAPLSPAHYHPHSFLIYSWSKSLSIPGERIGYVALNPRAAERAGLANALNFTVRTLGFVNAPASMQWIAGKLLDVTVDLDWYRLRRDRSIDALAAAGYEFTEPEGTFYVFPKAPGGDDVAFCNRALEQKVLLVPGSGFGRPGFFRIAFCVDDATLDGGLAALDRVAR